MTSLGPHIFKKIHFVTLGTVVAHECVCGNIIHADHAQSADTFRDVRDFLKPSYTQDEIYVSKQDITNKYFSRQQNDI